MQSRRTSGDGVGHGEDAVQPVGSSAGCASRRACSGVATGRVYGVGRTSCARLGRCPRFEPFRGLRYDPGAVRLDQVIAPPYDVIGSAERTTLAHRNPANSVRVELPEPDLQRGLDRYQVAAELLASWIDEADPGARPGARLLPLPHDLARRPGLHRGHRRPGRRRTTTSSPTSRPCPSPAATASTCCGPPAPTSPPSGGSRSTAGLRHLRPARADPVGDAFDDDGVRHQLWVLDDPVGVEAVRQAVAASPVVVADGHHRYETARDLPATR